MPLFGNTSHKKGSKVKVIDKEIKSIVNDAAEFAKESPELASDELWTDILVPVEE